MSQDKSVKDKSTFSTSNVFLESARMLEKVAEKSDSIIVSFSGGKDSLAVMQLCTRIFQRVVGMYMYTVPGLKCVEDQLQTARDLWPHVPLVYYPHWGVLRAVKSGCYRPTHFRLAEAIPDVTVIDLYKIAMEDLGIEYVAHGGKAADSLWRRRSMVATANESIVYPLAKWNKWDVLAYLRGNKIPLPKMSADASGTASGIDMTTPSLLWLHDNHPDDFAKLERMFPYARAVVYRRDWYGIFADDKEQE